MRRTRADELIVFHDARVAGIPVAQLTREEIGRRRRRVPPLLAEVLELAEGRVRIDVELKEDGYVERVLALVGERFTAPEVIVTSFLDPVIARVKQIEPAIGTGLLLGVDRPGSSPAHAAVGAAPGRAGAGLPGRLHRAAPRARTPRHACARRRRRTARDRVDGQPHRPHP